MAEPLPGNAERGALMDGQKEEAPAHETKKNSKWAVGLVGFFGLTMVVALIGLFAMHTSGGRSSAPATPETPLAETAIARQARNTQNEFDCQQHSSRDCETYYHCAWMGSTQFGGNGYCGFDSCKQHSQDSCTRYSLCSWSGTANSGFCEYTGSGPRGGFNPNSDCRGKSQHVCSAYPPCAWMSGGSGSCGVDSCTEHSNTRCDDYSLCDWMGSSSMGKCKYSPSGSGGGGGFNPGEGCSAHSWGICETYDDCGWMGDSTSGYCATDCVKHSYKTCESYGECAWMGSQNGGMCAIDGCRIHSYKTCDGYSLCRWKGSSNSGQCEYSPSNPDYICSKHSDRGPCYSDENCSWRFGKCVVFFDGGNCGKHSYQTCERYLNAEGMPNCYWSGSPTSSQARCGFSGDAGGGSSNGGGGGGFGGSSNGGGGGGFGGKKSMATDGPDTAPSTDDPSSAPSTDDANPGKSMVPPEEKVTMWHTNREPFPSSFELVLGESTDRQMQMDQVYALTDLAKHHQAADHQMESMALWHCRQTGDSTSCEQKNPCCYFNDVHQKCIAKDNHEAMHLYSLGSCNAGFYLKAMNEACSASKDNTCCFRESSGEYSFKPEGFGARCSLGMGMADNSLPDTGDTSTSNKPGVGTPASRSAVPPSTSNKPGAGGFNPGDCSQHPYKTCSTYSQCAWMGKQNGGICATDSCTLHSYKTCESKLQCGWFGSTNNGFCKYTGGSGGGGGFNPGTGDCNQHSYKTCETFDECDWTGSECATDWCSAHKSKDTCGFDMNCGYKSPSGPCKNGGEVCGDHTSDKTCDLDPNCSWDGPQTLGACHSNGSSGGGGGGGFGGAGSTNGGSGGSRSLPPPPPMTWEPSPDMAPKLKWSTKRAPFASTFYLDLGDSDNREMQIEQVHALLDVKARHPKADDMLSHMMSNFCSKISLTQCGQPFHPCCEVKNMKCVATSFWDVTHTYQPGQCNAGVWLEGLQNWCKDSCDKNCCRNQPGNCGFALEGVSNTCPFMDGSGNGGGGGGFGGAGRRLAM